MATITIGGNEIHTQGTLPEVGSAAPDFRLTNTDLQDISLADYKGKNVVLNIFPSVDTEVCAMSVRNFNQKMSDQDNTVVLCVSKDLPFAHKRFCAAEGLENVIPASEYKDQSFSEAYHVDMTDGPLNGLMSRAVVVIDPQGTVAYVEQVPEIAQEPDYEHALAALK